MANRYRITRLGFDVVSVFGSLWARALPIPVIVALLGERGYSESSVRNQIGRMVTRGAMRAEKVGKFAVVSLEPHVEAYFLQVSPAAVTPVYDGSLSLLLYEVPEVSRTCRDKLLYIAQHHGYGKLRSGALLGVVDRSHEVLPFVELPQDAWATATTLRPVSQRQAQELVERAYRVSEKVQEIEGVSTQVAQLERSYRSSSVLSPPKYYDVFFTASMLGFRLPSLPDEVTVGPNLAVVQAKLMKTLLELHSVALRASEKAVANTVPSAHLIEYRDR